MSPLSLRRYRAERLLRSEFDALRGRVLGTVRARLRAAGVSLDRCDLEACYGQAWQGLYAATLDGREITNPSAWLALVTFRRAIEEHRAQIGAQGRCAPPPRECDLAGDLDDRVRLRQLFEGLCARLSARERDAATLCYLQGLSRSEAAARLGVSELRMRRLMDGRGVGRPGVASKVGELAEAIRAGDWCEQQGSLMRGLAYGVLDPDGHRYRLALLHSRECPACRAYVASLRGLAAALPPVFLPYGITAGVLARLAGGARLEAAGSGGGPGAATGAAANTGGQVAQGLGGAVPAGAAGASGAAGGGWLITGGLAGKLTVGCLLALGVGAGCVALDREGGLVHRPHPAHLSELARAVGVVSEQHQQAIAAPFSLLAPPADHLAAPPVLSPARLLRREFGPESQRGASLARFSAPAGPRSAPRAAASRISTGTGQSSLAPEARAVGEAGSGAQLPAGDATAAAREFAPG